MRRKTSKVEAPETRREPLLRGWWWVDRKVAALMADAASEGIVGADVVIKPLVHGHAIVEAWTETIDAMRGVADVLRQCMEHAAGYPISPDDFTAHVSRLTPPRYEDL